MNKRGFTLVELLVVIAIIGVLSIIIVPSVISINKRINERLYNQKKENIVSAARLYASNNDEIFNGVDEVYVYVYELIDVNYLTTDAKAGDNNCKTNDEKGSSTTKGCMISPIDKTSMNKDYVVLSKEASGYSSDYVETGSSGGTSSSTPSTLVEVICSKLDSGEFSGQTGSTSNPVSCKCDRTVNPTKLVNASGTEVNACILAGPDVNNYLKYGDTQANWRVIGLYKIDGKISAKMITKDVLSDN